MRWLRHFLLSALLSSATTVAWAQVYGEVLIQPVPKGFETAFRTTFGTNIPFQTGQIIRIRREKLMVPEGETLNHWSVSVRTLFQGVPDNDTPEQWMLRAQWQMANQMCGDEIRSAISTSTSNGYDEATGALYCPRLARSSTATQVGMQVGGTQRSDTGTIDLEPIVGSADDKPRSVYLKSILGKGTMYLVSYTLAREASETDMATAKAYLDQVVLCRKGSSDHPCPDNYESWVMPR